MYLLDSVDKRGPALRALQCVISSFSWHILSSFPIKLQTNKHLLATCYERMGRYAQAFHTLKGTRIFTPLQ